MLEETFLDLARTWKYAGLPADTQFNLSEGFGLFSDSKKAIEYLVERARFMLATYSLEDVEAYFSVVLESVVVPNVIRYTVSGGKNWKSERK